MGSILWFIWKDRGQDSNLLCRYLGPCFRLPSRRRTFCYGLCCACSRIKRKIDCCSIWLQRTWSTLLWKRNRPQLSCSYWWNSHSSWLCLKAVWRSNYCDNWSLNGRLHSCKSCPQDRNWIDIKPSTYSCTRSICDRCRWRDGYGRVTFHGSYRKEQAITVLWPEISCQVWNLKWLSER